MPKLPGPMPGTPPILRPGVWPFASTPDVGDLQRLLKEAERLLGVGKISEAQKILENLANVAPTFFAAWKLLGAVHFSAGSIWAALASSQRAALLNVRDASVHLQISRCYEALGGWELAEAALGLAATIDPTASEVLAARGRLLARQGKFGEALDNLSKARTLHPRSADIIHSLGQAHAHLGDPAAALECFVVAFKLEKRSAPTSLRLSSLLSSIASNPLPVHGIDVVKEAEDLERAFPQGAPGDIPARLKAVKALGFEKKGEFAKAWAEMKAANDLIWSARARSQAEIARTKGEADYARARAFAVLPAAKFDHNQPVALFVTGPSRAGKSVLETLMATVFAGVAPTYESGIVERMVARTAVENGFSSMQDVSLLPRELSSSFGRTLRDEIKRLAGDRKFVVDTHPATAVCAGWVARALQNAFFIFVARDEDDNALRCLQKVYDSGNAFSHNLAECRSHLRWHRNMARTWVERLPGRSMMVEYEEIVGSSESVLRKVADAVGAELTGRLSSPGDDRGCAVPYREFMH